MDEGGEREQNYSKRNQQSEQKQGARKEETKAIRSTSDVHRLETKESKGNPNVGVLLCVPFVNFGNQLIN